MKEGGSVERPSLLDGTNYSYWKASMKAFYQVNERENMEGYTDPLGSSHEKE